VTDEVGARTGQDRMIGRLPARERGGARDRPHFVVDIGACKDANDPRQLLRGIGLDGIDFCVCVWTADEFCVEHTREFQVIDIGRDTLDEARILYALHGAAEVSTGGFHIGGGLCHQGHLYIHPFFAACSTASTQ